MLLERRLYEMERQFWTGGAEIYRAHADEKCLAVFDEMTALLDREQIAQSAGAGGRWQDVMMERKAIIRPAQTVAIICYEAPVPGAATAVRTMPWSAQAMSGVAPTGK